MSITKSDGRRPRVDGGDASTANVTRRHFATMTGGALAGVALGGCYGLASSYPSDGRLAARPRTDIKTSASEERPLRLDPERDAILRMPRKAAPPFPLLVLLHGATGSSERILRRLGAAPDETGVAVLAPGFARGHVGCDERAVRRGRPVHQPRARAGVQHRRR